MNSKKIYLLFVIILFIITTGCYQGSATNDSLVVGNADNESGASNNKPILENEESERDAETVKLVQEHDHSNCNHDKDENQHVEENNAPYNIIAETRYDMLSESTEIGLSAAAHDSEFCFDVMSRVSPDAHYVEEPKNSESFIMGDVNRDDRIDITDAILCARVAVGIIDKEGAHFLLHCEYNALDTNGDSLVTIADAVLIARFAAGMVDSFPNSGELYTHLQRLIEINHNNSIATESVKGQLPENLSLVLVPDIANPFIAVSNPVADIPVGSYTRSYNQDLIETTFAVKPENAGSSYKDFIVESMSASYQIEGITLGRIIGETFVGKDDSEYEIDGTVLSPLLTQINGTYYLLDKEQETVVSTGEFTSNFQTLLISDYSIKSNGLKKFNEPVLQNTGKLDSIQQVSPLVRSTRNSSHSHIYTVKGNDTLDGANHGGLQIQYVTENRLCSCGDGYSIIVQRTDTDKNSPTYGQLIDVPENESRKIYGIQPYSEDCGPGRHVYKDTGKTEDREDTSKKFYREYKYQTCNGCPETRWKATSVVKCVKHVDVDTGKVVKGSFADEIKNCRKRYETRQKCKNCGIGSNINAIHYTPKHFGYHQINGKKEGCMTWVAEKCNECSDEKNYRETGVQHEYPSEPTSTTGNQHSGTHYYACTGGCGSQQEEDYVEGLRD